MCVLLNSGSNLFKKKIIFLIIYLKYLRKTNKFFESSKNMILICNLRSDVLSVTLVKFNKYVMERIAIFRDLLIRSQSDTKKS